MEIYDFLNLFTDLSSVRIRIFDLRIEDIVFDSRNHPDAPDMVQEIAHSGFDMYEVSSVDLYRDENGFTTLELNIETDEDDEEDE